MDGRSEAEVADLVVNPAGTSAFGRTHVILNGRATAPMRVDSFTGPFSIKSVISGAAVWETRHGRYEVVPGRYLVLNHGTTYSLTIDARTPVETFCLFFRSGFVEEALRSATSGERALLDMPDSRGESFELLETLHDAGAGPLYGLVSAMHRTLDDRWPAGPCDVGRAPRGGHRGDRALSRSGAAERAVAVDPRGHSP